MVPWKPLPTVGAGDIDDLACLEHVDFEFPAGREIVAVRTCISEVTEDGYRRGK